MLVRQEAVRNKCPPTIGCTIGMGADDRRSRWATVDRIPEAGLTDSGKAGPKGGSGAQPDRVLRAKYLDYCSARVAEVLLRLTADDMYVLAQEVAGESGGENEEVPSFGTIVRLATERITRDLSLPDFSDWVGEYRKDPERFEHEMIGLWEADLKPSNQGAN